MEKITVLIADDEAWMRNTVEQTISKRLDEFCIVNKAADGLQTLEMIIQYQPDIVLSDIKMPGMDGIDLLECVRDEGLDTFFVFFSGYDSFSYAKKAIHLGASGYLLKPIDDDELWECLDKVKEEIMEREKRKKEKWKLERMQNVEQLLEGIYAGGESLHSLGFSDKTNMYVISFAVSCSENVGQKVRRQTMIRVKETLGILCQQIFDENQIVTAYTLTTQGIDAVISAESSIDILKVKEICTQIIHKFQVISEKNIACGIGTEVCLPGQIPESAVQAHRALAYKLFTDYGSVNIYSEDLDSEQETVVMNEAMRQRIKETFNGRRQNLCDIIKQHICEIQSSNKITIEDMKRFNADFIDLILNEVESSGVMAQENGLNRHMLYEEMCEADTLQVLFAQYQEFIIKCEELVSIRSIQYHARIADSIKKYIQEHYMDDIGLDTVSSHLSFHPSYISKIFKEQYHETVVDYIVAYRMKMAKQLIAATKHGLYQIGSMVGYKDPKYFSKVFKKYTGTTLSEYANRVR